MEHLHLIFGTKKSLLFRLQSKSIELNHKFLLPKFEVFSDNILNIFIQVQSTIQYEDCADSALSNNSG